MFGRRLRVGVAAAIVAVGFVAASFGGKSARGDAPIDEDVPSGAIAFFAGGACPGGWAPADDTEGRAVVGVIDGPSVGVSVGAPLGDREDRTHVHPYSAPATLGGKGVLAFDGWNEDGAKAKTYTVAGSTSAKTSGLAFVQVQACAKL
ncbi:MAG: hypothetical protein HYV09_23385 [Deltaproteobacteria bacterium]|nr:hypothetical protein [Deltaproteobacteria bacterium]